MINIEELKRLAESAKDWDWSDKSYNEDRLYSSPELAACEYSAAANPQTILALIQQLEESNRREANDYIDLQEDRDRIKAEEMRSTIRIAELQAELESANQARHNVCALLDQALEQNEAMRKELEEARKDAANLCTKTLELCEWSVEALERIDREWGLGRSFNELRSCADDDATLIQAVIDAAREQSS